ncbi:hypothetical protein D3C81_1574180 [compost metagenome]
MSPGGLDVAAFAEYLHDDGGRGQYKAGTADKGHLPWKAEGDANTCKQYRTQYNLHAAQAENLSAQAPQVRRFHFQADDEQEHHDAQFGHMDDGLCIRHQAQA